MVGKAETTTQQAMKTVGSWTQEVGEADEEVGKLVKWWGQSDKRRQANDK